LPPKPLGDLTPSDSGLKPLGKMGVFDILIHALKRVAMVEELIAISALRKLIIEFTRYLNSISIAPILLWQLRI
jgi:hypothetical protein